MEGTGTGAGPCAHPAGCEKFSWALFIVSITPGNEASAIRTQLAVCWDCARQNRIPGLQGAGLFSGSLESTAGNK